MRRVERWPRVSPNMAFSLGFRYGERTGWQTDPNLAEQLTQTTRDWDPNTTTLQLEIEVHTMIDTTTLANAVSE